MKTQFNSLDIACCVHELQKLVGMRVNQIYDVNHKTYLFKLQLQDKKDVLLIESGVRFHMTSYEWPKNICPSGFTMKLRKHLKNKRIESVKQLGNDRIIDFQFGSGEAAHHVILELFNRGNIVLTNNLLITLNVLRPHTEGDRYKFSVREPYPIFRAREITGPLTMDQLTEVFKNAKTGDKINKILLHHTDYGSALVDHILSLAGISRNAKYEGDVPLEILESLADKLKIGEEIFKDVRSQPSKVMPFLLNCKNLLLVYNISENVAKILKEIYHGYIIKLEEPRFSQENLVRYVEFHPCLFSQYEGCLYVEFDSFNLAVDEFYSKTESQRIEYKAYQAVCTDKSWHAQSLHGKILGSLDVTEENRRKAELIMANSEIIEEIICTVRRAIMMQMSWPDIVHMFLELARQGNSVFSSIHGFKLETNQITLSLCDPYEEGDKAIKTPILVDVDLALSACANATRYYSNKKSAAIKELKTVESQSKAIKSAEKKARVILKDIETTATITKARKVYWFEKFYWFVSSDNYLVIAGRDQHQNELIVKRYLKKGDIYVHADLNGASSVVVKNPTGNPIPPRTLNEAGNMAVCYSIGWEAKVMCSAWWVRHDQVSKTAPAGEYLTTGSFMIRGQKNFLLPAQLAMGFGFMFKLEESSVFRHAGERKTKCGLMDAVIDEPVKENLVESDITSGQNDVSKEMCSLDELSKKMYIKDGVSKYSHINSKETSNLDAVRKESYSQDDASNEVYNSDDDYKRDQDQDSCSKGDVDPEDLSTDTEDETSTKQHAANHVNHKPKTEFPDVDNILKRGQRSKLKKIKEKYKNQDEEERVLRMYVLKSDGKKKEPKKSKKTKHPLPKVGGSPEERSTRPPKMPKEDFLEEEEDEPIAEELDMIDFLTGQPHPEDEMLFAVPVIAPYSALLSFKYKVKIIPGTSKR
uniref:NFACT RNA-binding domain-containing protein n=1 Tax=Rhodnius prolixus TaxID=13249 RepID=T1HIM3_RHOPR